MICLSEVYKIERLDHFGRGILNIDGKTVFVNNAFIGDEVEIRIIKSKKNYSEADVINYKKTSNLRKDNYCKYSNICGGCDIGGLLYKEQLKFKEDKIKNIIDKYLKKDIKINSIIYDKDINYRNKITLHVKNNESGLYKKQSNEIINIDECYLVSDKINDLIKRLNKFIKSNKHHLNQVVIKNTSYDEVMLVFNGKIKKELILNEFSDINSIYINNECIKNKFIKDKIGGYDFYLSKDSFFQVNRFNTVNLYNEIVRLIKDKKIKSVLDLYCGVGTIGIYISKYVDSVVGVEVVEDAILSANKNKVINNISNIEFICSDVEKIIGEFNNIDLVIVDPPRSGLSSKIIKGLNLINSKYIIYVSCDIMTMTRDLKMLDENYCIKELTPVDMFPNTYHCESVCILERK